MLARPKTCHALVILVTCIVVFLLPAPRASAQTGACCIGTTCTIRTFTACDDAGGDFLDGPCTGNPCAVGRCCINGACTIARDFECTGSWMLGGSCSPNPCPPPSGSCCSGTNCTVTTQTACSDTWRSGFACTGGCPVVCCQTSNGTCQILPLASCTGFNFGPGGTCSTTLCQGGPGACCIRPSVCVMAGHNIDCNINKHGDWQGALTSCYPSLDCSAGAGACCVGTACSFGIHYTCVVSLEGTFQGAGSVCTPTPCAVACCVLNSPTCTIRTPANCSDVGGFAVGTTCSPSMCAGACCNGATFSCTITPVGLCPSPSQFQGRGSVCSPDPCIGVSGACCGAAGACTRVFSGGCTGTYLGNGTTCTPCNPCVVQTPGACCNGTVCTLTCGSSCTGVFYSNVTTCGEAGNPTTCCPANFNGTGGLTVADIFAFLTAWFAGSPSANFNGVGGVTVADIFAFLAAWFAGCP